MEINPWPELAFWQSADWAEAQRKLDLMEQLHVRFHPHRERIFLPLTNCDLPNVLFVGQEPYQEARFATGHYLSTPTEVAGGDLPQQIRDFFKEYSTDLRYPVPSSGNLRRWQIQGVVLWNSCPIVVKDKPLLTHWDSWVSLTKEIVERVSQAGAVCVFVGARARQFAQYASGPAIECGSPSSKSFVGSRIFSRVNAELVRLKKPTIDWRLE